MNKPNYNRTTQKNISNKSRSYGRNNHKSNTVNNITNDKEFKKQVFIEIPSLVKKQKKLNDFLVETKDDIKIIHKYGELVVNNNKILDNTNIECESYKQVIKGCGSNVEVEIVVYINKFIEAPKHVVSQIPYHHTVIKRRTQQYKITKNSKVSFNIEKSIVFDDSSKDYELNLDDTDNAIMYSYYFILDNENEDSYFIKDDIFAFLNYLN